MNDIKLKELVLSGRGVDVALFVVCEQCTGVGSYEVVQKGGPWGFDRTYQEHCRRCYKENGVATGMQMVKIPFSQLVEAIRTSG